MAGTHTYQVGVIFASLAGAAGFPLAVLVWRRFHGTPFGRTLESNAPESPDSFESPSDQITTDE